MRRAEPALRFAAALAAAVLALAPAPATALDLDGARAQGLVGEQLDGYVGAVSASPPAEVKQLVESVNAKRREAYAEIARRNGTAIEAVAALAGQKLVDRLPPGAWVGANGHWYQKR